MPPPPGMAPQGGKAVLIASLIISVILLVVAVVLFFNKVGENEKLVKDLKEEQDKWKYTVDLDSELFKGLREEAEKGETNALALVEKQRADAVRAILGQQGTTDEARRAIAATITETNKVFTDASIPPPIQLTSTSTILGALPLLADEIVKREAAIKTEKDALAALQAQKTQLETQHAQAIAAKDQLIQAEAAKVTQETAKIDQARTTKDAEMTQKVQDHTAQLATLNTAITQLQTVIQQKDLEIAKKVEEVKKLENYYRKFRQNAKENVIRQADGTITRVPGDGTCFISRGMGEQITPGMTFEVYDKNKGIPKLGDGLATADDDAARRAAAVAIRKEGGFDLENDLPVGKGSIEVIGVGPGSTSQCRIIKVEPNQTITEGDLIGNLLYDPNTKFKWFVYGDFDFDRNGIPSTQDTAVVKRLIQQWGSTVVPVRDPADPFSSLTVDVDFIVMGMEPIVPSVDPNNPGNAADEFRIKQMQTARDMYMKMIERAVDLGIPILNQTRFLYYIGYYDQARR